MKKYIFNSQNEFRRYVELTMEKELPPEEAIARDMLISIFKDARLEKNPSLKELKIERARKYATWFFLTFVETSRYIML